MFFIWLATLFLSHFLVNVSKLSDKVVGGIKRGFVSNLVGSEFTELKLKLTAIT